MTRTKRPVKKTSKECPEFSDLSKFRQKVQLTLERYNFQKENFIKNALTMVKDECAFALQKIPPSMRNKTVAECKNTPVYNSIYSNTASSQLLMSVTKSKPGTEKKIRKTKRSLSAHIDDEGYLTAEYSSGTSTSGRQSRARSSTIKSTRVSRSLSRAKPNKYVTPSNNKVMKGVGTITPKCNPKTPQCILRRPKQGEVALSMQGSPLMTSAVVSETVANINIPLGDGRLFSIQPQRGLRISQIPDLDPEIKRQLDALRENLNKVCDQPTMKAKK